jgi:arginase family enzyme
MSDLLYADAESPLEGATVAIIGAPFEKTTCHRRGCAEGPRAIREESYNFETYIPGVDFELTDMAMCDCGDLEGQDFNSLAASARDMARQVLASGAFPVMMGGEHSVTPVWLSALMGTDPWDLTDGMGGIGGGKSTGGGAGGSNATGGGAGHDAAPSQVRPCRWADDFCVVVVDAHMDYRDGYLGERLSHASAARRVADLVGPDSVVPFGVRSYSSGEKADVDEAGLTFVSADEVRDRGPEACVAPALERVPAGKRDRVYLSVDIDGIDPAYAPAVGTPEPFGLTPLHVRGLIRELAPRLVGFDIVEVRPGGDDGNTAALAARLISEVMALVGRK